MEAVRAVGVVISPPQRGTADRNSCCGPEEPRRNVLPPTDDLHRMVLLVWILFFLSQCKGRTLFSYLKWLLLLARAVTKSDSEPQNILTAVMTQSRDCSDSRYWAIIKLVSSPSLCFFSPWCHKIESLMQKHEELDTNMTIRTTKQTGYWLRT